MRRTHARLFEVLCFSFTPTGNSTGSALKQLGLRTYALPEVFGPNHAAIGQDHPLKWAAILERRASVEKAMFGEYDALVGIPVTCAAESLLAICDKNTKVIMVKETHSARWHTMLREAGWPLAEKIRTIAERAAPFKPWHSLIKNMFPPESVDATSHLEQLEALVLREVPPERLLIHRHEDGWAPLCRFLDRPAPLRKEGVNYGDGQPPTENDGSSRLQPFPELDYGERELEALQLRFDRVLDTSQRILRLLAVATASVFIFGVSWMAGAKASQPKSLRVRQESSLVDMEENPNPGPLSDSARLPRLPGGLVKVPR